MANLPKFSELPVFEKTGERHAWGVWGKDDEIGMVNLLTPEVVKHAASLVRKGKMFNIEPSKGVPPPNSPEHVVFEHHVSVGVQGRSDYVDHWPLHGGWAHLDGLLHKRYREFGYYGGRQEEDIDRDGLLGIDKWAQHGMIGRGVLIDVAAYLDRHGEVLDTNKRFYIGHELIQNVAREQGVTFASGDIILLRTGWQRWYLGLSAAEKARIGNATAEAERKDIDYIVLDRFQSTAEWLWDHQIVAIWADNGAVESHSLGDPEQEGIGSMHRRMLALMGMGIGEFFIFDELAEDCAKDGVYECMVSAKPINLPGAVGSSANAYAVK